VRLILRDLLRQMIPELQEAEKAADRCPFILAFFVVAGSNDKRVV
jgi:hypothetical protein